MALYEYYCKECGITIEENRRVRDRDKPCLCESCGNVSERQVGLSNFHLKGICWSKDNYRNKGGVPPGYEVKK